MVLHHPTLKAFFVASFAALTLAPADVPQGGSSRSPAGARDAPEPDKVAAKPAPRASIGSGHASAGEPSACPASMILVEGDHCPEVEQTCLKWLDPPPYQNLRCGEFAKPARCKVAKVKKRFCIDREEYADSADPSALPVVNKSWTAAQSLCAARGARLCKAAEWELACEGPEMSPYPYGWKRDASFCNHDRTDLGGANEKLNDHRAPLSAFPRCVSPFGVHNMVGNVDEWVEREGLAAPNRSALRGGWWLPGRNRCRAATLHHDESYSAKQVGFRCCKDAP